SFAGLSLSAVGCLSSCAARAGCARPRLVGSVRSLATVLAAGLAAGLDARLSTGHLLRFAATTLYPPMPQRYPARFRRHGRNAQRGIMTLDAAARMGKTTRKSRRKPAPASARGGRRLVDKDMRHAKAVASGDRDLGRAMAVEHHASSEEERVAQLLIAT